MATMLNCNEFFCRLSPYISIIKSVICTCTNGIRGNSPDNVFLDHNDLHIPHMHYNLLHWKRWNLRISNLCNVSHVCCRLLSDPNKSLPLYCFQMIWLVEWQSPFQACFHEPLVVKSSPCMQQCIVLKTTSSKLSSIGVLLIGIGFCR